MRPGKPDAYNILLGHGGDMEHMPFSKEHVAKLGFQYVALGHMHKPAHILKIIWHLPEHWSHFLIQRLESTAIF